MQRTGQNVFKKCICTINKELLSPKTKTATIIPIRTHIRANPDPRYFTLVQHAKSRFLDEQRRCGILSNKIEVNRVRLHFETTGDGPQTVLLLPGGLGCSRTDFEMQMSEFNKNDYTLIAFDPRGYGKSIPPNRTFPLEFLQRDADDAYELVKKLRINKLSILGFSDGCMTAMIFAAKHPYLVEKLIVWGGNAYVTDKDIQAYEAIRDISNWSENMRSPFLTVYGEEYFKKTWNDWVDAMVKYYKKRNGNICIEDLKNIKCKTLIIHGLKDPLVGLEHADFLHHNIKGSRLYIMPEGKHNLHIRYHREFNFMVEHFLKEA